MRAGPVPDGAHRRRRQPHLGRFLTDNVVEGSTVITDGWQGYRSATRRVPPRRRVIGRPDARSVSRRASRRSLVKRWLLGTHQGGIGDTHLQDYLDEFTFRFNRRTSQPVGCCSSGSSNRLPSPTPCATATSSSPQHRQPHATHPTGTRLGPTPSPSPHSTGPGATQPADQPAALKWIPLQRRLGQGRTGFATATTQADPVSISLPAARAEL